jgi:hypothetical protein
MSTDVLIDSKRTFITGQVQRFRETKSIRHLLEALVLVMRQQRTLELLYGVYCQLFHRASKVFSPDDQAALGAILQQKTALPQRGNLSRTELIGLYGNKFRVELLPQNFERARCESIWRQADDFLIIGEYGEGSRIACVTPQACVLSDFYRQRQGVRHIHSIERYGESGEFLVATGDTKKFLDVWCIENGRARFARRVRKQLAGFTAAVRVNGEYYFGTDFSSRPNYITTLTGSKYFFPEKAYRMFVTAFNPFFDRFIVSVNHELRVVGGRKTLSVFDTVLQRFIYCEYWADEDQESSSGAA